MSNNQYSDKQFFGQTADHKDTYLYRLRNHNGCEAAITDYGATIVSLIVPDHTGKQTDIILGYDNVTGYECNNYYFGATIGRNCNRIRHARFCLNDQVYELDHNDGDNNLHSGLNGFDRMIWDVTDYEPQKLILHLSSPDMSQNMPGTMEVTATFTLNDANEFQIQYQATTDQDSLFNLTNHSYFNLNGHNSGTINDHLLQIYSNSYTPVDAEGIPDGSVSPIVHTVFDFQEPKRILASVNEPVEQLIRVHGYDHNYILTYDKGIRKAATAIGLKTGILINLFTDTQGLQFYSGNFLIKHSGKQQSIYDKRSGFCLEPQNVPDAVNQSHFASPVIRKGNVATRTIRLELQHISTE